MISSKLHHIVDLVRERDRITSELNRLRERARLVDAAIDAVLNGAGSNPEMHITKASSKSAAKPSVKIDPKAKTKRRRAKAESH